MALSDERIWDSDAIMSANAEAGLPMPILGMLCRTVEAEVRKQDEALILMLVGRLERADKISGYPNNKAAIATARARLEGKP